MFVIICVLAWIILRGLQSVPLLRTWSEGSEPSAQSGLCKTSALPLA